MRESPQRFCCDRLRLIERGAERPRTASMKPGVRVAGTAHHHVDPALRELVCWGLSRHINYLGEFMMATGLTLCLYPLYYVLLLVPRQIDDDRRCAAKYGELWAEYRRVVPKRIVPFVY